SQTFILATGEAFLGQYRAFLLMLKIRETDRNLTHFILLLQTKSNIVIKYRSVSRIFSISKNARY
ncbi:MAG: hypothetical protein AAF546_12360, partial [Verrucomicrobiota bacterium]